MNIIPLFFQDAYKAGHPRQYIPQTTRVYSNLTPRGSKHFHYNKFNGKIVWYGGRNFVQDLKEMFDEDFFSRPKEKVVGRYRKMVNSALGGKIGVGHIEALHDLGYLPIRIKALREGNLVNLRVPTMTVVNTHDDFGWLTNFIETLWSQDTWKPSTIATITYEYRKLSMYWAQRTMSPEEFTVFQQHDFSARGMSHHMDSAVSSSGTLLSSLGSDTLAAGEYATMRLGVEWGEDPILFAPPATEHAVMCMRYAFFGDGVMEAGETESIRDLITNVYPTGMCAIVSDTLDYFNVLTSVARELKPEIMARPDDAAGPGKVVFRPDSGDPYKIICGDNNWPVVDHTMHAADVVRFAFNHYYPTSGSGRSGHKFERTHFAHVIERTVDGGLQFWKIQFPAGMYGDYPNEVDTIQDPADVGLMLLYRPTPEEMGSLACLWQNFPGQINDAGFRNLDSHVGLIYGDSITLELADRIWARMFELGWASCNIVFGVGSFTYQYLTRDTFGWAIKATYAEIQGRSYDLQKTPKTDDGTKHSAKGLLRVEIENGEYVLYQSQTWEQEAQGALETIFLDSEVMNLQTLPEMRELLWPTTQAVEAELEVATA
jgi:nicotinamide phosphoribosyltransferase